MPRFTTEVAHGLGRKEATERLEKLLQGVRERYQDQLDDLEHSWNGDTLTVSFSAFAMNIKGKMSVEDERVVVEGTFPLAAMIFRGQAEQTIRRELEKVLA